MCVWEQQLFILKSTVRRTEAEAKKSWSMGPGHWLLDTEEKLVNGQRHWLLDTGEKLVNEVTSLTSVVLPCASKNYGMKQSLNRAGSLVSLLPNLFCTIVVRRRVCLFLQPFCVLYDGFGDESWQGFLARLGLSLASEWLLPEESISHSAVYF